MPIGIVPVDRVLVAEPAIIAVRIGDDVRSEHVIVDNGIHSPPSSKH